MEILEKILPSGGILILIVLIFRWFNSRISNIETMVKEFVPDDEYKKFKNGQDKKMSDFVTAKEYKLHMSHCSKEFGQGRKRMDSIETKVDSIISELKPIGEGVAVLMDRARRFRDSDLK